MAETTAISWTDATFNPWIGCSKVSPGCDHCYAEVSTPARAMKIEWGAQTARHRTSASNWATPQHWNAAHNAFFTIHARRRRVFCASLADVFDNTVPPVWRTDLWNLIRSTPNLDWLILTKRIGNVLRMLPADWEGGYPNVWLGATIVNQAEFDRDKGRLAAVPACIHFISFEPLLDTIDLRGDLAGIDWLIVGGESGPRARRPPEGAIEQLIAQRDAFNAAFPRAPVCFHFKQWGGSTADKGGAVLNGVEIKEWPDSER